MRRVKDWLVRFLRENWLFLLVMGIVIGAFLMLRTTASAVDSMAEVDAQLHSGQPTLIEFYSNT